MEQQQPLTPRDIGYLRSLPEREYRSFLDEVRQVDPTKAAAISRQVEQLTIETTDKARVADFFGVTVESISNWQTKGMPYVAGGKGGRNHYDLAACAKWICKQRAGRTTESDSLKDVEAEYRNEKRLIAELQRRKLQGELVDRAAYQQQMTIVLDELRKQMDLMARTWGTEWLIDMERAISHVEAKLLGTSSEETE